ncbi:hypothetical protein ARMGADRAFT_1075223 [Armillaria gallica]|uniref:Peptidase C14 caspase domain-containing protein n=1 Tax=Armillaria gallica TaxID=47427 RepID=A0A2H3E5E5_ARMGA|nr:hypothetical protein ARMGADRAFT_1075223 [Armillaria gallica]
MVSHIVPTSSNLRDHYLADGPPEEKPSSPPSYIDPNHAKKSNDTVHHSPPQSITIERPAPSLFVLAIGIGEYLSNGIRNLSGAVADADAVNKFSQKTLRVPKSQTKNLRNEEATRVTIEMEINNLGNSTAIKSDPILIFAEHGAETNAPAPTEKIQMLVPHDFIPSGLDDSKQGQGVLDVRLTHLLADLAAKKLDNITVILDCCHSGSTDDDDPTLAVRTINLPETYTVPLHDIEPDARASVVAKEFEKTDKTRNPAHNANGTTSAHPLTRRASTLWKLSRPMGSQERRSSLSLLASALGTVVAINTTAFTATCKFSSHGNGTPFPLTAPGYALQTRVGEDQDVRLFVESDKKLRGVFKRTANKTQAGKRGFRLVESRDDELDLVVAADGDVVHFKIMDKLCRQHGLTRIAIRSQN